MTAAGWAVSDCGERSCWPQRFSSCGRASAAAHLRTHSFRFRRNTIRRKPGAGGYQIAYNLAGKKAKYKVVKKAGTVSAWLKKLKKGKKYTVRIRAYRVISGTKYYSAWSAAKTKKVK